MRQCHTLAPRFRAAAPVRHNGRVKSDQEPHNPGTGTTPPAACGLPRRLLAMLYDGLVVVALWILAGALALPITGAGTRAGTDPGFTLYLLLIWYGYFAWCWQHGGMTLGMRAWRIRLLSDTDEPLTWWRSGQRLLAAVVSALPAGAGFIWSLFDAEKKAWHDRWSGTRLVRA